VRQLIEHADDLRLVRESISIYVSAEFGFAGARRDTRQHRAEYGYR